MKLEALNTHLTSLSLMTLNYQETCLSELLRLKIITISEQTTS